ncbi:precorrin-2 dehydrogenase/sirohydrochlorin ferrochelatase family protein [Sphingomonas lenta]|uniref:precorrin-2 dehydrogenase n=1 Tax=Sphingomonas lenta TaxID=1141887 RepID=A0A2A2SGK8_9SPHN|nr:NAD(P)-dependent oxidoreductase [Sphingomonas lenta]PAX08358.1 siroheme synthase [Sphingomonas lenta]
MLLGEGEAADAKRRLLERAGAAVVGEEGNARLAVIAIEDEAEALAAVERLRARGLLVNAVDRPELCDFTLPAVVDRAPVLVAIGTGGVSAGLAAALRQRLEALIPAGLGERARALFVARDSLRARFPDPAARRRALGAAMAPGGPLDPLGEGDAEAWLADPEPAEPASLRIMLASPDPDDLTLRQARALANADRLYYRPGVPPAILSRARADAERIATDRPPAAGVFLEMAPETAA